MEFNFLCFYFFIFLKKKEIKKDRMGGLHYIYPLHYPKRNIIERLAHVLYLYDSFSDAYI